MCGPKTGAGPNSVHSPLPRNIAGKNEPVRAANPAQLSGDADELDDEFTSPVGNSFHAWPSFTKRVDPAGLRIPTADSHLEVDDGYIPTLDPATEERKKKASQASALPPLALREISSKTQSADLLQEHLGEDDHQTGHTRGIAKETETLPKRFAASEKMLAKTGAALRLEARAKRARERPQRERLKLLKEREKWAIFEKSATNETLDRIDHVGGLKEWNEAKAGFKLVGVDILVGVYKLPEQTARQVMLTLEGAINTAIKTGNIVLSRDINEGLVSLPKPDETKSVTGRHLGEIIGILFPGGIVARAFRGVRTYQQFRNASVGKKISAQIFERGLGSLLTSNEKENIFVHSLEHFPENKKALSDYFKDKTTLEFLRDKFIKGAEDAAMFRKLAPLLIAAKEIVRRKEKAGLRDLMPKQSMIDSQARKRARHGNR